MANAWDFLGAFKDDFMKSSMDVYTNLSGNLQYVGKTQNEKTISPNIEILEWFDNTSGTQTLYKLDIDKFDLSVQFAFLQMADPAALAIALNAELDTSHPTLNYLFLGSNPNTLPEAEWRFVGQATDGRGFTVVIRRGIVIPTGDISIGSPGAYSESPVTLRALQDTTITNGKRDTAYIMIDKRTFS